MNTLLASSWQTEWVISIRRSNQKTSDAGLQNLSQSTANYYNCTIPPIISSFFTISYRLWIEKGKWAKETWTQGFMPWISTKVSFMGVTDWLESWGWKGPQGLSNLIPGTHAGFIALKPFPDRCQSWLFLKTSNEWHFTTSLGSLFTVLTLFSVREFYWGLMQICIAELSIYCHMSCLSGKGEYFSPSAS